MNKQTPEYQAALERTKRGMASLKKPKTSPPVRRNTVGFYPPTPRPRTTPVEPPAKKSRERPLDTARPSTAPSPPKPCLFAGSKKEGTDTGYSGKCRCDKCKMAHSAYSARYRAENDLGMRNCLKTYGITREFWDQMLAAQGGGCAICGGVNESGRRLHMDHDHRCCPTSPTCGQCNRGLLCGTCNTGLGSFQDSIELLYAAAEYLTKYSDRHLDNEWFQQHRCT